MGDLIRTPYSEVTSTLELLELFDRLGITPDDFGRIRKASSWNQDIVGRVCRADPFLWAMLEIEQNARKVGFLESDFRSLAGDEEKLRHVLMFLRASGISSTAQPQYIIDCDATPFEPYGLRVASECEQLPNRVRGQFVFDAKVKLYLSKHQRGKNGCIVGKKLRKKLALKSVLNANILDYLLNNIHLIPENLKKDENGNTRRTFFWGTIYCDLYGGLCVRYLCFIGGGWGSDRYSLDHLWEGCDPAAVRES